ncbi:MAG: hypothetical protein ACOCG5_09615 [Candidatus Alkaliphilus sp. MAG34]
MFEKRRLCLYGKDISLKSTGGSISSSGASDCVKNVILSEAKDLKWPKNEILRYTQNLHVLPTPR